MSSSGKQQTKHKSKVAAIAAAKAAAESESSTSSPANLSIRDRLTAPSSRGPSSNLPSIANKGTVVIGKDASVIVNSSSSTPDARQKNSSKQLSPSHANSPRESAAANSAKKSSGVWAHSENQVRLCAFVLNGYFQRSILLNLSATKVCCSMSESPWGAATGFHEIEQSVSRNQPSIEPWFFAIHESFERRKSKNEQILMIIDRFELSELPGWIWAEKRKSTSKSHLLMNSDIFSK
jgi:hypothetical protein